MRVCPQSEYSQLYEVMREKHIEIVPGVDTGDAQATFGEGNMFFDGVTTVMAAIRVIAETKGRVFVNARYDGCRLITSKQGEAVLRAMRESPSEYERAKSRYKLSPYINAFYDVRKSTSFEIRSDACRCDAKESLTQISAFALALYESVSTKKFKQMQRAHERAVNKLSYSFMQYIDDLLSVCARLLVVRIDLSYKAQDIEAFYSQTPEYLAEQRHSNQSLFQHRVELIHRLSKRDSPYAMVGYAWKLEYGHRKGFHYHLMLFLDGSKVMKHIEIGKAIGEMWASDITGGEGHYWNCTGSAFYYKSCGVGEVDHYDLEKISAVKSAALYLVKIDRWISAYLPDGKRCFGKGVVKKSIGSKRGRPRTKQPGGTSI